MYGAGYGLLYRWCCIDAVLYVLLCILFDECCCIDVVVCMVLHMRCFLYGVVCIWLC